MDVLQDAEERGTCEYRTYRGSGNKMWYNNFMHQLNWHLQPCYNIIRGQTKRQSKFSLRTDITGFTFFRLLKCTVSVILSKHKISNSIRQLFKRCNEMLMYDFGNLLFSITFYHFNWDIFLQATLSNVYGN